MEVSRVEAGSVLLSDIFWVTGGQSTEGYLDSTEFYSFVENRWIAGPKLPEKLTKHSMAKLDNKTVLITGGGLKKKLLRLNTNPQRNLGLQWNFHPDSSKRNWLYDIETKTFTETGRFKHPRIEHSCAQLQLENAEGG